MIKITLIYENQKKICSRIPSEELNNNECLDEWIMLICEKMSEDNTAIFFVEGFNLKWPIDVLTDLSCIIPQLPFAIEALKKDKTFSLEFFEQGLERKMIFYYSPEKNRIKCYSLFDHLCSPIIESIKPSELECLLRTLLKNFIQIANNYNSNFHFLFKKEYHNF
jgi:hypothetical protein